MSLINLLAIAGGLNWSMGGYSRQRSYPAYSARECERRKRQIAKGMLKVSHG